MLIGVAGGPVFCVWFSWYMTAKRIPEIEKNHSEQLRIKEEEHKEVLTSLHKAHADHINLITTNYRADMNTMWTQKREDDKELVNALRVLTDLIREGGACKGQPA